MFLKKKNDGHLVEVLSLKDLFDPFNGEIITSPSPRVSGNDRGSQPVLYFSSMPCTIWLMYIRGRTGKGHRLEGFTDMVAVSEKSWVMSYVDGQCTGCQHILHV